MEDCERTLCGGIGVVRRFGGLLGLGWREVISVNLLGNTDPVNTNQSQKKRHNSVPLAFTEVTVLDPFLWALRESGKWAMWLSETPQGLWGVEARLYFLSIVLNGEGNLFMKLKGTAWIIKIQVLRLLEKDRKRQCFNVALKTSLIHYHLCLLLFAYHCHVNVTTTVCTLSTFSRAFRSIKASFSNVVRVADWYKCNHVDVQCVACKTPPQE